MSISLPGLVSELNTKEIIDALMNVERIPRTLLAAKSDDRKLVISQLQSLNASLQELATKAKDAAGADALSQSTATSSSDAVKVVTRAGAAATSTQLVVDRVATAHSTVSAAFATMPGDPLTFTVENAAGERTEVTLAAGASPAEIARALTGAGAGITAAAVPAGTDADGTAVFRLQLTATETGAAGAFRIFRGTNDEVAAGTAVDLSTAPGAAVVTTGADAQVRLWAGTAAEQVVTSAGNTFTDLFPGVDVTVSRASVDPVTVTVGADEDARVEAADAFVTRIAALLAGVAKGSTATAGSAPGEATTLGVFTGDSTVRSLRQALTNAVQFPVDGVSPSTIGISIDRYGVLAFDEEKFRAAMTEDPASVQAVFSGMATRVQDVADQYSDKYDGLLTSRITGQEDEVTRIGEQLESWDYRLAQRRETLERTYAAMETMLSRLQTQSSYLESQLSALNPSKK